ncbi:MAG: SDR family oxidoreductase [Deltaproteobacteria bacterium]|nr:SDR family oxidoreductase [Deltaproteobacteria bacterium]MBW2447790.1 SDR family oxidoreductase [Deltaproteobacteria bacterium]
MELRGKRVLITGASRGLGRGMAEAFAREGATVALVARSEASIRELAEKLGGSAHPCDLMDPAQVVGLIERVESEAGPVDVLVNNAGVSHVDHMLSNTPEQIDQVLQTNLVAPIQISRQAIPRMIERGGGHIVNMSSIAAILAPPGLVHYGASKAGLSHYTAGLRGEVGKQGIETTLVEIGSAATEMDDATQAYGPYKKMRGKKSEREMQMPVEEVVDAVVDAVKTGRKHVRLPKSVASLGMFNEVPRRLGELVFSRLGE